LRVELDVIPRPKPAPWLGIRKYPKGEGRREIPQLAALW
jgi:hypothetical protein